MATTAAPISSVATPGRRQRRPTAPSGASSGGRASSTSVSTASPAPGLSRATQVRASHARTIGLPA
jgi:hypothetical protein